MPAVAAVGEDEGVGGEAQPDQPGADGARAGERHLVLRIRAGDARRPSGVDVDVEPATAQDVHVARRVALLDVVSDTVDRPRQEVAMDGVRDDVHARCPPAPGGGFAHQRLAAGVIIVAAHRAALGLEHPQLRHGAGLQQEVERLANRIERARRAVLGRITPGR